MDYSDRTHKDRTVYQLALGACDYNVKDENGNIVVDGMIEMIEEHFKNLPMPQHIKDQIKVFEREQATIKIENLKTEYINNIMCNQYEGQFPEGQEAEEEKRVQQDEEALDKLMNVIKAIKDDENDDAYVESTSALDDTIHRIIRTEKSELADKLRSLVSTVMKAPSNEAFDIAFEAFERFLITQDGFIDEKATVFDFSLLKALYQFRNHLEPKEEQTFGKHFNHQLLDYASQSYADNYVRFGNDWDSPKNLFVWKKVLGGLDRGVPACDAQVIAQEPWSIMENGEKSRRSLKLTYGGESYYPLGGDSTREIGYNCSFQETAAISQGTMRRVAAFKTYLKQKFRLPCLPNTHTVSHKRKAIDEMSVLSVKNRRQK